MNKTTVLIECFLYTVLYSSIHVTVKGTTVTLSFASAWAPGSGAMLSPWELSGPLLVLFWTHIYYIICYCMYFSTIIFLGNVLDILVIRFISFNLHIFYQFLTTCRRRLPLPPIHLPPVHLPPWLCLNPNVLTRSLVVSAA